MKIEELHYISQQGKKGESHSEMIRRACENGVRWVQFRVKDKKGNELVELAQESQEICKAHKAVFIINDYVELAHILNADGVHLGKEDCSITEARRILGNNKIIGGTANDLQTIIALTQSKVNYIGLGPFRNTNTKVNLSPVIGLKGFENLMNTLRNGNIKTPIIAIGGIKEEDVPELKKCGVYGVAVASQINFSEEPRRIIEQYKKELCYAESID